MSKTSFTFNLISTAYVLQVTMNIEALNIHIKNSYQVNNSKEMKQIIDMIMNKSCYKQLAAAGYTRTKESLLREWKAHSVLYRLGYKKEQTGSADLNQNESRGRRIAYFFLSWFY
jgi:hypothetical protein